MQRTVDELQRAKDDLPTAQRDAMAALETQKKKYEQKGTGKCA